MTTIFSQNKEKIPTPNPAINNFNLKLLSTLSSIFKSKKINKKNIFKKILFRKLNIFLFNNYINLLLNVSLVSKLTKTAKTIVININKLIT